MFVASGLYRYATGSNATASTSQSTASDATPSDTRVKRHPKRTAPKNASAANLDSIDADADVDASPGSPPPSYASVASGATDEERKRAKDAKLAVIETILAEEDLYKVLGVKRNAQTDEIRRGFLNRSRSCHPDKFPGYPAATAAFQKVSFAYETLSKPSSRRMYDVSGRTDFAAAMNNDDPQAASAGLGDDTLNGVLYSVFCEFMEGDFEMIRVLVNALNEGNPSMNLGDDAVDSIEGVFRRLREVTFAGKRYLSIIKFELIRLYEIQQALRQLSYFNITGRLKLTLQLARVTINIPLAIDQAMKQPGSEQKGPTDLPGQSKGSGAAQEGDDNGQAASSASSSDEEDEIPDGVPTRSGSSHRRSAEGAFGVAEEDSGSDEPDSYAREQASQRRKAQRARRREQRRQTRARIRHERSNSHAANADGVGSESEETKQQQLQRRGLLPATAVGLLKGVVRVLETSEAWVPGGK